MATNQQPQIPASVQRREMLEQIDRLDAAGMDVRDLRDGLARLRLPDDVMVVHLSHADTIIGAAQLRAIANHLGNRMPEETIALLERMAVALMSAEVRQ